MTYLVLDPVAIDFGFIQIHWYGLMYVFGFLGGYALAIYRISRGLFPINREQMSDLLTWIALGVILGGRSGYMIFYQPARLLDEPLSLFFIWEGGMAFHGGLIGVIVLTWVFARRHRVAPLALGDALAPLIPIGLGLGRLGNFIGGELWGRPTDMHWGIVFPRADELSRHPSQLYQFALEGIVLFVVLWTFSAKSRPPGQVTGLFLLGYGVFRFAVEFVREPDAQLGFIWLNWMTMGQMLSIPMIAVGIWLLMLRKGHLNARIS
ncbi:MAG TPA: prolipoprotein diacylglyceryl transferase [Gammaproteobacteria bacterium]|nr:prolipoprotein diacylglyceryl transferase [Gammaproteobacteria bacterium]